MNQFFKHIGNAITSVSAIIFVLILTISGLITCTHSLFYQVLPFSMGDTERELASWVLSIAFESTLLLVTANNAILSKKISVVTAIASGIIVLFFIQAFDFNQPPIILMQKIFIGLIISSINYTFTELFHVRWEQANAQKNLVEKMNELKTEYISQNNELTKTKSDLEKSKSDFDQLFSYTEELESFKAKELEKLKCPYCHGQYETIFKLTSHKGVCSLNPRKGMKQSVFEEVQSSR